MAQDAWKITFEATPNPQSLKFLAAKPIAEGSAEFRSAQEAQLRSPLARKIFGFPWTDAVFVGRDFVTVTKQDWVDWETLAEPLADLIAEHLERGEPVLLAERATASATATASTRAAGSAEATGEVATILDILETEIRPAVALDGGDVEFERFEDGVVYLRMQGACSGCPSSAMTLKQGIEVRLRNAVPAIREVVAV